MELTRRDTLKYGAAAAAMFALPEWAVPALAQGEVDVPFTDYPDTFAANPANGERRFSDRLAANFTHPRNWVDDAVGDGTVTLVGQQFVDASGVWLTEFFNRSVKHVWKRDGKEIRRANQPLRGKRWRTSSRYTGISAGSYVVEVMAGEKKLGEVAFKVQ